MPQPPTRIAFVAGKTSTHAFFNPEGTQVEMSFGGVTIVSDPDSILNLSAKLAKLAREAMTQKSKAGGQYGLIQVTHVARASAEAPPGQAVVVLGFQAANGTVEHFALAPEESQTLRPQMEKAENDARANRAQTLQ